MPHHRTNIVSLARWLRVGLLVYWIALLLGTHLPAQHMPQQLDPVDKLLHVIAYAGLTVLFFGAFPSLVWDGTVRFNRSGISYGAGLLVIHGALDEITQTFIPGRYPSSLDWVADCLGIGIGVVAISILLKVFRSVPVAVRRHGLRND